MLNKYRQLFCFNRQNIAIATNNLAQAHSQEKVFKSCKSYGLDISSISSIMIEVTYSFLGLLILHQMVN